MIGNPLRRRWQLWIVFADGSEHSMGFLGRYWIRAGADAEVGWLTTSLRRGTCTAASMIADGRMWIEVRGA